MIAGALTSGASVMTKSLGRQSGANRSWTGSAQTRTRSATASTNALLVIENALRLAERLLASGLIAGVVRLAGPLHRVHDRLRLCRAQVACLRFRARDGARRRLAMHGGKRRFGRRLPLSGGGVEELFDGDVGLVDPIRAGAGVRRRGDENKRHAGRRYRVSNNHFTLPSEAARERRDRALRRQHTR